MAETRGQLGTEIPGVLVGVGVANVWFMITVVVLDHPLPKGVYVALASAVWLGYNVVDALPSTSVQRRQLALSDSLALLAGVLACLVGAEVVAPKRQILELSLGALSLPWGLIIICTLVLRWRAVGMRPHHHD